MSQLLERIRNSGLTVRTAIALLLTFSLIGIGLGLWKAGSLLKENPTVHASVTSEASIRSDAIPRQLIQPSNVVILTQAIVVCTNFTDAEIADAIMRSEEKLKFPKTCWRINPGSRLMGISAAGKYALVAPLDDLDTKAWVNFHWLAIQ